MAVMAIDAIDGGQRCTVDGAIDLRDIDIREADRHASTPLPAIAADLFLQAALAGQDRKGGPSVARAQGGVRVHALFPGVTGNRVDHTGDHLARDVRQFVESQDGSGGALRQRFDRVPGCMGRLE
jgi:hypothetical protein